MAFNSASRAFRNYRRYLQGHGVNYRRAIITGANPSSSLAVPGMGPRDELISVLRYVGLVAGGAAFSDVEEIHTETEADAVQAFLETNLAGANNDLRFIAQSAYDGAKGNSIRVKYLDPALASAALSVSVSGFDVTVSLATDGALAITTTAEEIIDAVAAHSPARQLVDVKRKAGNDGSGVVIALVITNLSGGVDADPDNVTVNEVAPVQAFITASAGQGANAVAKYIAQSPFVGTLGNNITVEYLDPAANNAVLSISVSAKAITVHLATGAGGAITSTANEILDAIAASDAARALVDGDIPSGTGNDAVAAALYTLASGADAKVTITIASPADSSDDRLQVDWLSRA